MDKPYLLIVTGRPGSGKTTFTRNLSDEICMPVVSRDRIKEGYVHTIGRGHSELPPDTNKLVSDIFIKAIMEMVINNISLIAEAAFQHRVWENLLAPLINKTRLFILICETDEKTAWERYIGRGLNDASREYFHGDPGVDLARKGLYARAGAYDEPRLDAPTLHIDTKCGYKPSVQDIIRQITKK